MTKAKKKKLKIALCIIAIIIVIFISFLIITMRPVSKNTDEVTFVIEPGTNKVQIASNLKKAGIIRSKISALIYIFFTPGINMQAGEYKIDRSDSTKKIIEQIASGNTNIIEVVNVTLVEGMRFTEYVDLLSETFNISKDEFIAKCSDTEFLNTLIDKYWFIDSQVLNDKLYYPLEGYIYPDTYEFYENATIEDIVYKLLDNMDTKLSPYKDQINTSNYNIHEILTIASIAEKEALNASDRKTVSQVIYKRLSLGMSLGMDVTTYYGVKKDLQDELTYNDLNSYNDYNTRNSKYIGLPVGPICSPSLESIDAALNPSDTDYIYFIANIKTGKVYFASSYDEFINYKNELGD